VEDKKLPVRSHHTDVAPKKVLHQLDSPLRQSITGGELLDQTVPMTDQITEMRQKTEQIHPQPGSSVNHRGQVIPELG
jgi:hypothetical protein